MNIDIHDLINVCVILDQLIDERVAEENADVEQTIGKPLTKLHSTVLAYQSNTLEDLRDMRDRLFNQIPLELL